MSASAVYLPEAAFVEIRDIGRQERKKGFKRPGFRLVSSQKWSPEEIEEAFSEPPEKYGRRGDIPTRPFQGSA
jgi:hypothetical protein